MYSLRPRVGYQEEGMVEIRADICPGPRNRAPLGNKTTNAKAAAFHTPGPPTQEKPSAKPTSPRVRRAKIKIHTLGVTNVNEGDNEPDIELMPAREMPLPDYPDDWPHDRAYPQFESENKTRGWFSEFAGRKHEDDDSDFSNFAEELRDVEQRKNDEPREQIKTASHKTVLNSCTTKPLQTLKSRDAALALSRPLTSTTPGFAAPTAAAKARAPSVIPTQSRLSAQGTTFGASRHTVARAASNTTVGFSKGRAVSATKRALLSRSCDDDVSEYNLVHRPGDRGRSALEDLFGTASLAIETTGSSSAGVSGLREFDDDEDEVLRNFQLETVDVTQA